MVSKKYHLGLWVLLGLILIAIFPPGSDLALFGLVGGLLLIVLPFYLIIKWLWNKQKEQLKKLKTQPRKSNSSSLFPMNVPNGPYNTNMPFTSKIVDTVIGIILLIILWPYLIGFLNTAFVSNVNTIDTASDSGIVANANRLLSEYQDELNLVTEIQQRTDALGTSATNGHYVEWKLRNNNAVDAGERLATYITEHFNELDAKWASDVLSWIAKNKERLLRDNQSLEQAISRFEGS